MKTSAPVHVDRLARTLRANGIDLKRSKVIEIASAAFGFHNSNEFLAAARAGDLAPPEAAAIGQTRLRDGTRLVVLQDPSGVPYAMVRNDDGKRASTIGVTPYGGLVTLPDEVADLPDVGAAAAPAGSVVIDVNVLSALVEAADGHGDALQDDLEDDGLASDHRQSTQDSLDGLNSAIALARGLYGEATAASTSTDGARDRDVGRRVVHVAIMRTPHHDDVRFSVDPAHLERLVANHCRANWGSLATALASNLDPATFPDAQVVEMFYAAHAADDEPSYSLERREQETDASTASELELFAMTWGKEAFRPAFDPVAVAASLEAGVDADIWDDDAAARRDAAAVEEIATTKQAMVAAASLLRGTADRTAARPTTSRPMTSDAGGNEPVWTTDVEGDVVYGLTRDDLENFGLDYDYEDGEWLPLTQKEFGYLQPEAGISGPGTIHRNLLSTPDLDGVEVKVGQSCVWKGSKWQVPYVEFSFGEDERDGAFRRLEEYVDGLKPILDQLGGEVRVHADATDYAHGVDVFVPMEVALGFQGTEDWARALAWLLCPADQRNRMTIVEASIPAALGYRTTWDATFDVLREGRAKAIAYLRGDRDDQLTMRLAESPLAHKDAWALWNEDWELELDLDALRKLYGLK
jgi:hypothetical protein